MAVNADTESRLNAPAWKPGIRLAPESKELLLFRSTEVSLRSQFGAARSVPAIVAAFCCC